VEQNSVQNYGQNPGQNPQQNPLLRKVEQNSVQNYGQNLEQNYTNIAETNAQTFAQILSRIWLNLSQRWIFLKSGYYKHANPKCAKNY